MSLIKMDDAPAHINTEIDVNSVDFTPIDTSAVLSRPVPWSSYKTLVPEGVVSLMVDYDKQSPSTQKGLLERKGVEYAKAFLALLENIHQTEPLQYIMTLIENAVIVAPRWDGSPDPEGPIQYFHKLAQTGADPYGAFLRLLTHRSWYILNSAIKIISLLFSTSEAVPANYQEIFVSWLTRILKAPKLPEVAIRAVLEALNSALRVDAHRAIFVQNEGLCRLSAQLTAHKGQEQFLYTLGLNLWLVSYNEASVHAMDTDGLLEKMTEVIRTVQKEKVLRVFIATLRNIVTAGALNEDLIEIGFLKTVQLLTSKKWPDEDIEEDLKYLKETLESNVTELSTFDKYQKEVTSGRLDWTPAHTNEQFWRENINKFEANEFELIRILISFLKKPDTAPKAICVCLNDIGEFSRNHARGKIIIQEMKGKERVMELLLHTDSSVRKNALMCMQKMLIQKQHFLVGK